jgi:hypothetical protein
MLSKTSQWHTTMPVGGGIHAINKADADDPLYDLKLAIQALGKKSLPWWKRRGDEIISSVHYRKTVRIGRTTSQANTDILSLC